MKPLASIGYGFAIWAVASVIFRVLGAELLGAHPGMTVALIAAAAVPAIAGLTLAGFRILHIERPHRAASAALFAATGMFLDSLAIYWWRTAYPDLGSELDGPFGALMLWCNAVALVTGVVASANGGMLDPSPATRIKPLDTSAPD